MDSSISDTLSGESCTTDEDNVKEHKIRDTLHKTVSERHLLLVIPVNVVTTENSHQF
jgi:hypothetical protein